MLLALFRYLIFTVLVVIYPWIDYTVSNGKEAVREGHLQLQV